jgi:hypothetical protein
MEYIFRYFLFTAMYMRLKEVVQSSVIELDISHYFAIITHVV